MSQKLLNGLRGLADSEKLCRKRMPQIVHSDWSKASCLPVIQLEVTLIESSIPPASQWPSGNPFSLAWGFARESGQLLVRHPRLLVFSFFVTFWTTAIWINDITSTTSYSVDAEYGPTWSEAGLSLIASHVSNLIPAFAALGLLTATLTVLRGGGPDVRGRSRQQLEIYGLSSPWWLPTS